MDSTDRRIGPGRPRRGNGWKQPAGDRFRSNCMLLTRIAAVAALAFSIVGGGALAQERRMESTDAGKPVGGSAFHKNDITYSTAISTPHMAWATKLPGGPIRG